MPIPSLHRLPVRFALLPLAALAGLPSAQAAFIDDSKLVLDTRNIYFNRDFREGTAQSKREEWAHGFILRADSGFTEGPVGFGVDALGMLGLRLDSGRGRTGSGLLPIHDDGRAPSEYSKLGVAAKIKVSKTQLKLGTVIPKTPVLRPSDGRILPQTFRGALLDSNELSALKFTAGRVNRVTDRSEAHSDKIVLNSKNSRFAKNVEADHFSFGGLDYSFSKQWAGSYHVAQLDDVYRQHFLALQHNTALGEGNLKSELRYTRSDEQGSQRAGKIDNHATQALFNYKLGGQAFSLSYQQIGGDQGFVYIDGTDPYLVHFGQINDFADAKERSWQVRYDYEFSRQGIPGLSFMTRYTRGDRIEVAGRSDASEWERNTEVQYQLQDGLLKGLAIRWRNATYRSGYSRDADENRLILSYSFALR